MNAFNKSRNGYDIKESTIAELYALTRHWMSDLEFYGDDLRFLRDLIDKYLIWIIEKKHVDMVRSIEIKLLNIDRKCLELLNKTKDHLRHLGIQIENPEDENSQPLRSEHEHLEHEISNFVKLFRENRKEVFRITEYVVDSEQLIRVFDG